MVATVYSDSILGKLIIENKIGLISDPENVDTLAESLENIYNDNDFRKNASKKARSLIEENFDRNKIVKDFLNLLEDIDGKN